MNSELSYEEYFRIFDDAPKRLQNQEPEFNRLPDPNPFPQWLCCLLPCLKDTPNMLLYERYIPRVAWVVRNQEEKCIDSNVHFFC